MELSLTQATLVFGLVLLILGGSLLLQYNSVSALARKFPRSQRAGVALMALAMAWTAWKVMRLGAADYGDFKQYILIGFGVLGMLTFKYAADFLSVRAATILFLFSADGLLDAAWMRFEHPQRLALVAPVYLGIALSLYLAYAPYRARDFFGWLFASAKRAKAFASAVGLYGLALCGLAFSY